jgi:hypothetical protein
MSQPIFTNNGDFASRINSGAMADLMTLQAPTSAPESDATEIVTDALLPDRTVEDRLGHMDPELYDLSENSHLMRLMKVLLGGAGAGGIRKQIAVARLQNSFRGMHFLDLDRFYGALFGIKRTQAELMPDFGTLDRPASFDPYTDAAGSDTWDDVHSRDANYRDRLIKFARALPLGGTYAGLRAAAEALLSVECEVYESWIWVDEQNAVAAQPPVLVYTYTALNQTWPTWDTISTSRLWSNLSGGGSPGTFFLGRTGQKNRSEVLIQPKRTIRPDEQFQAMRVMDRLKPAGSQVTLDPEGLAIHQQVPIRAVAADSEHWEIIYKTTPSPGLVSPIPQRPVYPESDPAKCQPRPAFSGYQGESVCYNNDIVRVSSYKMIVRAVITSTNYATVIFRDGVSRSYLTSHAIMDGQTALAGRVVSDGVMTSFAYASRVSATTIKNASFARSYRT